MTALFCTNFSEEGNIILRIIMIQLNDITLGLILFALLFYGPIYIIFCYFSNKFRLKGNGLTELVYDYRRPIYDIIVGLGVAARHFEGGMSWILPLSNRLWLAVGYIFYLSIIYLGTLTKI